MTEQHTASYGDALTIPFWEAASRHELIMQRCDDCGHYQFYPRPFCLGCDSTRVSWTPVSGKGHVYSQTTVHIKVLPDLLPPYTVVLVTLDEGPRVLGAMLSRESQIGDRVQVAWQERSDAPPLPAFEVISHE